MRWDARLVMGADIRNVSLFIVISITMADVDFKIRKIVAFLFEVGTLRKLVRAHRQTLLTDDLSDNISSHSFRVAMIGRILASLEKADKYKVIMMCLFHDLSESRTGDQNWVNKSYVKVFEEEVFNSQLSDLPETEELSLLVKEYERRESLEAKVAKDADIIDQILLLREYSWQGNKEADDWLKGREQMKLLYSRTAKKVAREIYKQKPHYWWNNLWTYKRR